MKFSSIFSTIPLLALGLVGMVPGAEAFPAYQPQPRGIPNIRVSGGTRSPVEMSCLSDPGSPRLTSLFPEDDLGYTTDSYPAFQWYMPSNNASHVEFNLYEVVNDDEGIYQPVYQTAFVPSSEAGIATLKLPSAAGLAPLKSDTYYYWSVDVYCPDDSTAAMTAEGFVEFLEPDAALSESLAESEGLERAAIAAENSLWFDATRALTEQLQTQPDDQQVLASWNMLLESIGLENIADAPLLP
ncbi:DUF928 domain-containing protein [Leptolyngbya cf. ectocarpi LEGE 11479]|uniref:DUF928 domain-containing protein n=1 Tax=Leptolyngbya cf. ectocarpi LEGE 11479 TaxID=1828722 RepID=A0A928ZU26_LEPEC|nr:DUF928 domain-containing protein [Leptolyngbya ectocarpi]MBE9067467.1 DUF928 domain-containing protein [Leptolyngbya cf. ectocarpi LEGE 11479]